MVMACMTLMAMVVLVGRVVAVLSMHVIMVMVMVMGVTVAVVVPVFLQKVWIDVEFGIQVEAF